MLSLSSDELLASGLEDFSFRGSGESSFSLGGLGDFCNVLTGGDSGLEHFSSLDRLSGLELLSLTDSGVELFSLTVIGSGLGSGSGVELFSLIGGGDGLFSLTGSTGLGLFSLIGGGDGLFSLTGSGIGVLALTGSGVGLFSFNGSGAGLGLNSFSGSGLNEASFSRVGVSSSIIKMYVHSILTFYNQSQRIFLSIINTFFRKR